MSKKVNRETYLRGDGMRGIKQTVRRLIVLSFFSLTVLAGQAADPCNPSQEGDIFYGPGILKVCQYISLQDLTNREPQSVNFSAKDKKFPKAIDWIAKELYPSLNRKRDRSSIKETKFCIVLTTMQSSTASDLLLIIPLNRELLGPDYLSKIDRLRKILQSSEPSE